MGASLQLPGGLLTLNPQPEISRYYNLAGNPYTSTAQVLTQVISPIRYIGQTFLVLTQEYWFSPTTADADLVPKIALNTVTGTGTINYVAKWGTTSSLVNSILFDNGTNVLVGTAIDNLLGKLQVNGDITAKDVRIGRGSNANNVLLGFEAIKSSATGYYNTAIGDYTLKVLTSGIANTAVGYAAMNATTNGANNTALGSYSMFYSVGGSNNTVVGNVAMTIGSGHNNTIMGYDAFYFGTGSNNIGIGVHALVGNSGAASGSYNIALGTYAGRNISTGTRNIVIENLPEGASPVPGGITTGSYNIVLNPRTRSGIVTGSNNVVIGGFNNTIPDVSNSIFIGDGSGNLRIMSGSTGNILINTPTDNNTDKLQVNGSLIATAIKKVGGLVSEYLMADGSVSTGTFNNITGIGAAGQVSFFTGTNTIAGDIGFTWDNTNKRLGINNPAPSYQLEVNGLLTTGIDSVIRVNSAAQYVIIAVNATKAGGLGQPNISLQKNGTNVWSIGSDANSNGTKDFYFYDTTNNTFPFFVTNLGEVRLGSAGTSGTGGAFNSQKMTIKTNGNVLIGTTTDLGLPYSLQVNGAGSFTAGLKYGYGIWTNTADLNTLVNAGFYTSVNAPNAPTTGYYYITVEAFNVAGWVHQTATSFGNGGTPNTPNKVYTRVLNNTGNWTPWLEILTTGSGVVSGSGSLNYIPKWSSTTSLGNSIMSADANTVAINNGNLNIIGQYPYIYLTATGSGYNSYIQNGVNQTGQSAGDFLTFQNPVGKGFSFVQGAASVFGISTIGNTLVGTLTDNGIHKLQVNGDASINGLTVGRGSGNVLSNTVLGELALTANGTRDFITSIGYRSLQVFNDASGWGNTAIGAYTFTSLLIGTHNVAIGTVAGGTLNDKVTGLTSISDSIFLGFSASALADGDSNEIVIGYNANGLGSNSVVLGNDAVLKTVLKGNVLIATTTDNTVDKLQVAGSATVDRFKYTQAIAISGIDLNTVLDAGFYNGTGMPNAPSGDWFWVTVERHGDPLFAHQTATSFGVTTTPNKVYTRTRWNGTWNAWVEMLTSASGSITGIGITNYITKWTSPSTLGNSLIFDNGTNVLIGTTTDNGVDKLQINGSLIATAIKKVGGLATQYLMADGSITTTGGGGGGGEVSGSGTIGYLSKWTATTALGDSQVFETAGNVLIGTTTGNPTDKLQVNGSASILGIATVTAGRPIKVDANIGSVRIKGDSTGWGIGYFLNGASNIDLGGYGALGFNDTLSYYYIGYTYDNPSMILKPTVGGNGNVIIGTTVDNGVYKLQVNGSVYSKGLYVDNSTQFSYIAAPIASAVIGTAGTGGSLIVETPSLSNEYNSGLAVDGTYTAGKSVINISAFGVASGGPYSADLAFKTSTNSTLSEKMRITNTGNIGIGTVNPFEGVHIANAISGITTLRVGTNNSDNGVKLAWDNNTGNAYLRTVGALDWPLRLGAGNNSHMSIDTGGNVLIGTNVNNGVDRLQVNGSALVDKLKYTQSINITGQDLDIVTDAGFYSFDPTGTLNAPIGGSFLLTIERASTLNFAHQTATSIGNGNTPNRIFNRVRNGGIWGAWAEIKTSASAGAISGSGTTNYISKWSSTSGLTDSQIFDNGTNVGFNTNTPGAALDINRSSGNDVGIKLSQQGVVIWDIKNTATTGLFTIGNGGGPLFNITGSGNVLIGSTTDDGVYKLQVNGSARILNVLYADGIRPISVAGNLGQINIRGSIGGWADGYYFRGSADTPKGGFGAYGSDDTLGFYYIGDTYSNPSMIIQSMVGGAGRVLIGTTIDNGSDQLQVNGRGYFTGSLRILGGISSAAASNITLFQESPTVSVISAFGNDPGVKGSTVFRQYSSDGIPLDAMKINSNGNVLIGTTTDAGAYKLQVNGVARISGASGTQLLVDSAGAVARIDMAIAGSVVGRVQYDAGNGIILGTNVATHANLMVNNAIALRVNGSSGNTTLGDVTDDGVNRLQVNGSLIATAIKKVGGLSTQFLMADGSVSLGGGGGGISGSGTANYVPKFTSGTAVGNSVIYDLGTNNAVGIGTTAPRSVAGYTNITLQNTAGGTLHFRHGASVDTGGILGDATGITMRTLTAGLNLAWSLNNIEKMRMPDSGNLLLGTGTDAGPRLNIQAGTGVQMALFNPTLTNLEIAYLFGKSATDGNCGSLGFENTGTNTGMVFLETYASSMPVALNGNAGKVLVGTYTNNGVDALQVAGSVIADGYRIPGGLGTQYLMANGTTTTGGGGGISGSGTTNRIPKFTSSTAIGNSLIQEGSNNTVTFNFASVPLTIGSDATSPYYRAVGNFGHRFFVNTTTESVVFTSNGKVLIGPASDNGVLGDNLQVNGAIVSTSGFKKAGLTSNDALMAAGNTLPLQSGSFVPTFVTVAGTFTSITNLRSSYSKIGNIVTANISAFIETATATGYYEFTATLPVPRAGAGIYPMGTCTTYAGLIKDSTQAYSEATTTIKLFFNKTTGGLSNSIVSCTIQYDITY